MIAGAAIAVERDDARAHWTTVGGERLRRRRLREQHMALQEQLLAGPWG